MGMCPCGAEGQVGKKDNKREATNQELLMCFVAFTVPKNDNAQMLSRE